MKPETVNVVAPDRLATGDEIRSASSTTAYGAVEQCYSRGQYCEIDSDAGGRILYSTEEFEFFLYLSEEDSLRVN